MSKDALVKVEIPPELTKALSSTAQRIDRALEGALQKTYFDGFWAGFMLASVTLIIVYLLRGK